jgi:peptidoglycan/LPS O-acetylase OafA/YrhL
VLPTSIRDHVWTLVVLALSIAIASLSFHYFERPFLRLKKRFTFVAAREEVAPSA